jgi:hypothetical protein
VGTQIKLAQDGIEHSTTAVLNLQPEIRKRVEAAMFWVRTPRNLILQSYRSDILRVYSSYWIAFECLVEAVNKAVPRPTFPRKRNKSKSTICFSSVRVTSPPTIFRSVDKNIVNPGFVGMVKHALTVCFKADGDRYAEECFHLLPYADRLYDIRNAVNHRGIDAENPTELVRVDARIHRLWMIVWRMFGYFIPFPVPVDQKLLRPLSGR